jgi:NADH dehydrogenase FAD-containing subunit
MSTLILSWPGLASPSPAKVQVFDGSVDQVFNAAVKAIEKNWKKVKSTDLKTGTIQFHTGVSPSTWGEDCTALLRDLGNGKVEVSLKSTNSAQLYAWGVGGRIAQKLFKSIQEELSRSGSQVPPHPTHN